MAGDRGPRSGSRCCSKWQLAVFAPCGGERRCPAGRCRAEMASLRDLQARLDGGPFAIVPISVAEADGAVRRFFAGESLPFAVLLDRDRSVARAWGIHTLPSTVVLDGALKPRFIAE